jgi:hypothetical protein
VDDARAITFHALNARAIGRTGNMVDIRRMVENRRQTYIAVIKRSGAWWIGWIEEIPGVNCQERTRDAVLETLHVTLREALELNRREVLEAAGEGFEEAPIAV